MREDVILALKVYPLRSLPAIVVLKLCFLQFLAELLHQNVTNNAKEFWAADMKISPDTTAIPKEIARPVLSLCKDLASVGGRMFKLCATALWFLIAVNLVASHYCVGTFVNKYAMLANARIWITNACISENVAIYASTNAILDHFIAPKN
jgi:hypothetical protein